MTDRVEEKHLQNAQHGSIGTKSAESALELGVSEICSSVIRTSFFQSFCQKSRTCAEIIIIAVCTVPG